MFCIFITGCVVCSLIKSRDFCQITWESQKRDLAKNHVILPTINPPSEKMQNTNKPPFFIFIWIIDKGHNIEGGANELMRRVNLYQSALELIHKHSQCRSSFQLAFDMPTLLSYLRPPLDYGCEYHPVFVLTGHGDANTGAMRLWSDSCGSGVGSGSTEEDTATKGWLTTTKLMNQWRPAFACDLIASQCGANAFVSEFMYPVLLSYPNVRCMAACDVNRKCSHVHRFSDGSLAHVELTRFLMFYLRSRGEGCDLKAAKKWTAFLDDWKLVQQTTAISTVPIQQQQPATTTSTVVANPLVAQSPPVDQQRRPWIRYIVTFFIWFYVMPSRLSILGLILYCIAFYVLYRSLCRGQ